MLNRPWKSEPDSAKPLRQCLFQICLQWTVANEDNLNVFFTFTFELQDSVNDCLKVVPRLK